MWPQTLIKTLFESFTINEPGETRSFTSEGTLEQKQPLNMSR